MAVRQIPNLTQVVALSPTAQVEIVQAGTTYRASVGQIAALNVSGSGTLSIVNDVTDTNEAFPLVAKISSGNVSTLYASDPNYTYVASEARLTAKRMESSQGIALNSNAITENYTFPATDNGISAGPVAISALISVPVGCMWVIV